jgi:hypothetical protein
MAKVGPGLAETSAGLASMVLMQRLTKLAEIPANPGPTLAYLRD